MSKIKTTKRVAVATVLISFGHGSAVLADEDPLVLFKENATNAKSFRIDINAPTSPGFAVIGASPKEVVEPGNLQEFALHTASFVKDGKINPGVALNFQPFWLFNSGLSLEKYTGKDLSDNSVDGGMGKIERIFARTQLSAATVDRATPKSETGARFGFGFHTELLDGPDPRNIRAAVCYIKAYDDHVSKQEGQIALNISKALNAVKDELTPTELDALKAKIAAEEFNNLQIPEYDAATAACRDEAEKRVLAARSWIVGAGAAVSSKNNQFDNVRLEGGSIWSTLKQPFSDNKALTLFGKADFGQAFDAPDGSIVSADLFHAGLSLALVEQDWKLDATASYHLRNSSRSGLDDDYFQISVDGAYKLREGTWLEASFGRRSGARFADDQFAQVQLKLDMSAAANAFTN